MLVWDASTQNNGVLAHPQVLWDVQQLALVKVTIGTYQDHAIRPGLHRRLSGMADLLYFGMVHPQICIVVQRWLIDAVLMQE
jgi:hypothetical protein